MVRQVQEPGPLTTKMRWRARQWQWMLEAMKDGERSLGDAWAGAMVAPFSQEVADAQGGTC